MAQVRLHFEAARPSSTAVYAALEGAFDDDGYPLAIFERDEDAGIDEISVYVDDARADDVAARMADMATAILGTVVIEREALPDIDWVSKSLEGLRPVRAGRFLVHGSHDRHHRKIGDLAIEIDAGLAFGTGHHGTTAGCLDMIASVIRREQPRNALDLGTGSAVLAIGLAKLARIPVLATDIDPVATRVAAENVRKNEVAAYVTTATATGFANPVLALAAPFDLIVANILARPLMRLAPRMAAHLSPGGSLILSGILDRQRDAVIAAYVGQRFRHVRTTHREGWVTIHLKR